MREPRHAPQTRLPASAISMMGGNGRPRPSYPPGRTRSRPSRRGILVVLVIVALLSAGTLFGLAHRRGPQPGPPLVAEDTSTVIAYGTYLGGPERRSYGRGPAPSRLDLIWKAEIGSGKTNRKSDGKLVLWSGMGWTGQPLVVMDHGTPNLIVGGYDYGLRRIDMATGETVWRYEFEDVIKATPAVYLDPQRPVGDRAVIVAGSRRGAGLDIGDPRITPLRAVSFSSGTEIWRMGVPKTEQYSQDVDASSMLVDGRLIVAVEPGFVYALDAHKTTRSGENTVPVVIRKSPPLFTPADVAAHPDIGGANIAIEGSPALLGDRIYLASGSGHIYGLNRSTLRVEWDYAVGGDFDSTVAVTRSGKLLAGMEREHVPGHGGAFMLDPSKPPAEALVWFFPTLDRGIAEWNGGIVGSVAINDESDPDGTRPPLAAFNSVDGYLYVVAYDEIAGTDATGPRREAGLPTPRLVFKDHIGGSISTPVIVGDRIITAGFDDTVHLYSIGYEDARPGGVRTRDGRSVAVKVSETASFRAGGMIESTPLVWDGRVYIGCRDGYLYCIGER